MKTIIIKSRIGPDGLLKIKVPTDEKETNVEVVLVIQTEKKDKNIWPKNFLKSTYGSLKNNKIKRLSQGIYDNRDELL